jgi:hypothetical protein
MIMDRIYIVTTWSVDSSVGGKIRGVYMTVSEAYDAVHSYLRKEAELGEIFTEVPVLSEFKAENLIAYYVHKDKKYRLSVEFWYVNQPIKQTC